MLSLGETQHADADASDVKTPDSPSSDAPEAPIDPQAERRLLMKLDLIIFPVFFVVYLMAFLDRINISNAAIQGLTAELRLDEGNRFNVVLFVCPFFIPCSSGGRASKD
jgi:hypothetical protein